MKNPSGLQEKGLAIVTGASSGIGAEYARQLAARGYALLLVARREHRLLALAQELSGKHGVSVHVLPLDLGDPEAAERTRAEVERIGVPLKWLINNAGYGLLAAFDKNTVEDYRRYVRVLAMAPIEFVHVLLPHLKRAGPSHIINVASISAFLPCVPGSNLYPGAKAMLVKFTELLAFELEYTGANVTATVSCPGMTESEIFDSQVGVDVAQFKKVKFMPASVVVSQALAAAESGRITIIHGVGNVIASWLGKNVPDVLKRRYIRAGAQAILGDAK